MSSVDSANATSNSYYQYAVDYGFYDPIMCGSIDATDEKAHDKGLLRAESAPYEPNKSVKGDPDYTLFVARLDYATSEETLWKVFGQFGSIRRVRLVRDIITGISKGYAFIEFKHRADMRRAHREAMAPALIIDKREVLVEFELERKLDGWRPRRLGGGFGGRKESGQLRFGGRYKPFSLFKTARDSKRPRRSRSPK